MRLWAVAWHRLLGSPAGGLRRSRWHREVDRQPGEAGDVREERGERREPPSKRGEGREERASLEEQHQKVLEEAFAKFIGQMLRAVSTPEDTEIRLSISVAPWGQITSLPLPLGQRGAHFWSSSAKSGCANALKRNASHASVTAFHASPPHERS